VAERRLAAHKKGALDTGQTLVFVDECGFSERPTVRRTWAPRGHTPVIHEHFNWKHLSAAGAVVWRPGQPETRLFLSLRPGAYDKFSLVDYLRNLRRHLRGSVVLLWDGLPAHRSLVVKDYVTANAHWLTLEFFPGYAPELNPVEGLWADLKGHASANYAPEGLGELQQHLKGATRGLRRKDHRGLNYIKHTGLLSEDEHAELCKGQ
jgi:transposase